MVLIKAWKTVVLSLSLLSVAACGNADRIAELESEVAELESELAETTVPTTTPTSSTTSSVPATSTTIPVTTTSASSTTSTSSSPAPDSIVLEGSGQGVREVSGLTKQHFVLEIQINGGSVLLSDANGDQVAFLWATSPGYDGETLVRDPSSVSYVEVNPDTSDPWVVTLRRLTGDDVAQVPGTFAGSGDDLVYVEGASGSTVVTVDGTCDSRGLIRISGHDSTGGYTTGQDFDPEENDLPGETLIGGDTVLLAIEATLCTWSVTWP